MNGHKIINIIKLVIYTFLLSSLIYWIIYFTHSYLEVFFSSTAELWKRYDNEGRIFLIIVFVTLPSVLFIPKIRPGWLMETYRWTKINSFPVSIGLLIFVLGIAIIFGIPYLIEGDSPQSLDAELIRAKSEVWKVVVQSLGGIVLFVGVIFSYLRSRAEESQAIAAQEQVKASQQQVAAMEDGQITERYTEAIKLFGDENLAIRLGGIYALERIALDSLKREPEGQARDYRTVVEVLTAFIREKSKEAFEQKCSESGIMNPDSALTDDFDVKMLPPLREDIQAALNILWNLSDHENTKGMSFNLQGTYLPNAFLKNANFKLVNFQNAILINACFFGANLKGALFNEANLWNADLRNVCLYFAQLKGTNLMDANLEDANLEGANLEEAILAGANLKRTNLKRAYLSQSDLNNTNELTLEQLCEAKLLFGIKMSQRMSKLVEERCPEKQRLPWKIGNEPEDYPVDE